MQLKTHDSGYGLKAVSTSNLNLRLLALECNAPAAHWSKGTAPVVLQTCITFSSVCDI